MEHGINARQRTPEQAFDLRHRTRAATCLDPEEEGAPDMVTGARDELDAFLQEQKGATADGEPRLLPPLTQKGLLAALASFDTATGKVEEECLLAGLPELPAIGSKQQGSLSLQQAEDTQEIALLFEITHRQTSMDCGSEP